MSVPSIHISTSPSSARLVSSSVQAESSLSQRGKDAQVAPVSLNQEAWYYLEKLVQGQSPFVLAERFLLDGPLDVELFHEALAKVVARHDILRTHFEQGEATLRQVISERGLLPFEVVDLSAFPKALQGETLAELGAKEAGRVFSLEAGPLFHVLVARLSSEKHVLHLTFHQSVVDESSVGFFLEDLSRSYAGNPLAPLRLQYADFAARQRESLKNPAFEAHIGYWKEKLRGMSELELPADHQRPVVKSWRGGVVTASLPRALTDRLREFSSTHGATLFEGFLMVFNIFLCRYGRVSDIAVGVPESGRDRSETTPQIGTFFNPVLLRTDLSGGPDSIATLGRVRQTVADANRHRDVPFEVLVEKLRPSRDSSRNPLFQIAFSCQQAAPLPALGAARLEALPSLATAAIYDLHFSLEDHDGEWQLVCKYNSDVFERETAHRWTRHFEKLMDSVVSQPDVPVDRLPMLGEDELKQLAGWREERTPYPADKTVGGIFVEVATRYPDKVALIQGSTQFTYSQLHAHASQLAVKLQGMGVQPGTVVGLALRPSPETIIGLLGILLAGGAYVPIDVEYPEERVRQIIKDAGLEYIVSNRVTAASLPTGGHQFAFVELTEETPEIAEIAVPELTSQHPAYLLFTSGSTGRPKGVLIPHQGIVRLVHGTDYIAFGPQEVFLLAAPMAFDATTFEIWGALLHGSTLVIMASRSMGLAGLARTVREQGVTTLWLTAGLFQVVVEEYLEDLSGLRHLLAGGDTLPPAQVRTALRALPGTAVINGYGPTENTTFTTCHRIRSEDLVLPSLPIGRPIANTSAWILDANGQQVPVGVPGELYTGGDGLALEYWKNPELTALKFVANPCPQGGGERLYRTGDLARWRPDGSIEFLGRMDFQVKIRGCRVEPAEVEAVMASHPLVEQCKVAARGNDAGNKKLVCWVSPIPGATLDRRVLADYMSGKLPPFLCPDVIIPLEALPLTANGKIDMAALPSVDAEMSQAAPAELPKTPVEKMLAATCCQLLGISTLGRDDNFFELGGNSLMVLRLVARIRRTYGVGLPLASVLQGPTIRALANLIEKQESQSDDLTALESLVTLKPDGAKTPFFCVHGGGGNVFFIRHLGEWLPTDRPFIAIEAPALKGHREIKPESIPEIAREYCAIMRLRQPSGPYLLGGYSFGGLVAYEMACQLQAAGERVAFLALFDIYHPKAPVRPYTLLERIYMAWKRGGGFGWKQSANFLQRLSHRLLCYVGMRSEPAEVSVAKPPDPRGMALYHTHVAAMNAFEPTRFSGKLTLFKAAIGHGLIRYPVDFGWGAVASKVDVVEVPGGHFDLFEPGNGEVLVDKLGRRLDQADAG